MSSISDSRPHFRVGGTVETIDRNRAHRLATRRARIEANVLENRTVFISPSPYFTSILASLDIMGPSTIQAVTSDVAFMHYGDSTLKHEPGTEQQHRPVSIGNTIAAILVGLEAKTSFIETHYVDRQSGQIVSQEAGKGIRPNEFREQFFVVYDYNGGLSRSGGVPVRSPAPTAIPSGITFA